MRFVLEIFVEEMLSTRRVPEPVAFVKVRLVPETVVPMTVPPEAFVKVMEVSEATPVEFKDPAVRFPDAVMFVAEMLP